MHKISFLFVLLACLVIVSEAQLTFTSSWGGGKRSGTGSNTTPFNGCRNNENAMAAIYRLIQKEAERLLLCQKS
ncbi:hypothetical protein JYU34_005421 [Plutella xylostella]|uniref:Uncharacterized protein n=2 Tax=Plutella xylostella TaxID=51655 RepID=A0ABQ7QWM6_PLUXY|nr:adipokinetic hormone 1 [Plutella xylostella]KAG7309451.1 hypothetical protein JYU34_005421 [Plutella xylostella]CAG9130903.1 unnamed protein product [Plutella xylostella]